MQVFKFFNNESEERAWGLDKSWFQMSGELTVVPQPEEPEKNNKQLQQELNACQYFFDDNEVKKRETPSVQFQVVKPQSQ